MDNPGKNDTIGQLMGDIIPWWPEVRERLAGSTNTDTRGGRKRGKRIRKNLDFQ